MNNKGNKSLLAALSGFVVSLGEDALTGTRTVCIPIRATARDDHASRRNQTKTLRKLWSLRF